MRRTCSALRSEDAKHGEDRVTLGLTRALLQQRAYSTKGMLLRGCALLNLGRMDEAERQFAQLCVLLPENTDLPICLRAGA